MIYDFRLWIANLNAYYVHRMNKLMTIYMNSSMLYKMLSFMNDL